MGGAASAVAEAAATAAKAAAAAAAVGRRRGCGALSAPCALALALALAVTAACAAAALTAAEAAIAGLFSAARQAAAVRGIPKAAGSLPLLGHTVLLAREHGRAWEIFKEAVHSKGPVARVRIGLQHLLIVCEPKLLKQVMNTGTTDAARRHYEKDRDFSYKPFMGILGRGLVTSEGQHWRRQRNLVMKAFRVDILDEIVGVGARAAGALCAKLDAGYTSTGTHIGLSEEFRHLTLRVIVSALLDLDHAESDRVFPVLYLPIMEEANARTVQVWRPFLPTYDNFMFNYRNYKLNAYVKDIISRRWAERRARRGAQRERYDILEKVLDATAKRLSSSAASAARLPAAELQQLASEFKTFVLAGHETSAALLTWALHELTKPEHAHILARVRAEANATFGTDGPEAALRRAEEKSCATAIREGSMDYTLAVLKETLRLHTVVPVVTRTCVKDDVLGGYAIPRGATIVLGLEACHHSPDVWPDPLTFNPGNFYGKSGKDIPEFTFVPFIDGVRNCLGQHLALLEVRAVLGLLVQRYDFTPATDMEGERASAVIPIAPKYGMRMFVTPCAR